LISVVLMLFAMRAGAGGNWKRFDEKFDSSIVKQTNLSCVSAVGAMLLNYRGVYAISHAEIRDIIGNKASFYSLAVILNKFDNTTNGEAWLAEYRLPEDIDFVLKLKGFGIILQEPQFLGHAVFVKEVNHRNELLIFDPFDQMSYKMTKTDFNNAWGGGVVYRAKNK
jgi:ABC-type bacteriocin/lantibiotic exporter with double-glycine peptidase domain